jgi:hypothetical protein
MEPNVDEGTDRSHRVEDYRPSGGSTTTVSYDVRSPSGSRATLLLGVLFVASLGSIRCDLHSDRQIVRTSSREISSRIVGYRDPSQRNEYSEVADFLSFSNDGNDLLLYSLDPHDWQVTRHPLTIPAKASVRYSAKDWCESWSSIRAFVNPSGWILSAVRPLPGCFYATFGAPDLSRSWCLSDANETMVFLLEPEPGSIFPEIVRSRRGSRLWKVRLDLEFWPLDMSASVKLLWERATICDGNGILVLVLMDVVLILDKETGALVSRHRLEDLFPESVRLYYTNSSEIGRFFAQFAAFDSELRILAVWNQFGRRVELIDIPRASYVGSLDSGSPFRESGGSWYPWRLEISRRFVLAESYFAGRGTRRTRSVTRIHDVKTGSVVWEEDGHDISHVDLCALSDTEFLVAYLRDDAIHVQKYRLPDA